MTRLALKKVKTFILQFLITSFTLSPLAFIFYNSSNKTNTFSLSYQDCPCDFCHEIGAVTIPQTRNRSEQKNWTIIIYIAADNDLRSFAARNIKQMASIGSNEFVNILVHLDIRITGNKKITRRYYVEKDKILHMNAHDASSQCMDSGNPKTLISCCEWAINNYPAYEYALFFWNHGTGIIDPGYGRLINPAELFTFNPETNKLELDRSLGFLDLIDNLDQNQFLRIDQKGICWDDTTGNYLTNYKLETALDTICRKILNGNKFSIIGFDACLMSMLETASLIKNYAHIMVGSQEVELGTGWNYAKVLSPFAYQSLEKNDFAKHIVQMYYKTYSMLTNDFTLSAINLNQIINLEKNLNSVAQLLLECLANQKKQSVSQAIKASRNRLICTHFDEPSYID
ncbi:MAG: clostripain-related cysteine peptidase, partial [Candidatus Babeliales bacterium]